MTIQFERTTLCPKKRPHYMNHNVEKLFGFPKVKWLHLTGEVDKSVKCSYQIFSGFYIPKIIRVGYFLIELIKK